MSMKHLGLCVPLLASLALGGCGPAPGGEQMGALESGLAAAEWMELAYGQVQAERLSPPLASRVYAYTGLALGEAVGAGRGRSLSGRIPGMPAPPPLPQGEIDWPSVAAGAAAVVTGELLARSAAPIDALLKRQIAGRTEAGAAIEVVQASVAYGARIGEGLRAWAAADGFSDTRGLSYMLPAGPGLWEPTGSDRAPALEPYWGTLRPYALGRADACAPPAPVPYAIDASSPFYRQADVVYQAGRHLSMEQEGIARFWADGGGTGTPGGHWIWLLSQLVRERRMPLGQAAEAFAILGVTIGDSFISCWQGKYRWNVLRPETYIQRHIDSTWKPLLSTPPFPEYTSGHSVVSMASAQVLTALLGGGPFVDRTHEGRGLGSRTFGSFEAAAREAATSRLYGGIHYPMGIDKGLEQGQCVAHAVLRALKSE